MCEVIAVGSSLWGLVGSRSVGLLVLVVGGLQCSGVGAVVVCKSAPVGKALCGEGFVIRGGPFAYSGPRIFSG